MQKNKKTAAASSSSGVTNGHNNSVDVHVDVHAAAEEAATASSGSELEDALGSPNNAASGSVSALVRKVRRRSGLTAFDQELVRIVGQHLHTIGLKSSAEVLMAEAGTRLIHPTASTFKKLVLNGEWSQAVKTLDELKSHLENADSMQEMKFLLLEQKYLELLARGNSIEALKVLQTELSPLKHNQSRTHELSTYLMLSSPEDIARVTRSVRGGGSPPPPPRSSSSSAATNGVLVPSSSSTTNSDLTAITDPRSRTELMHRLQSFIPASVMLPPGRLMTLLDQAAEFQTDRCLRHTLKSGQNLTNAPLDPNYLTKDHKCSEQDFPCETIQVLSEHCEEVWYCRFSPNGLKLASGGKDHNVIIWDFDPETLLLKHGKTLERHTNGVAFFAWSPDSSKLAVCGPEDCDEVCIWNVDAGVLECKIAHSTEDSLTTVSWSPDGRKIACGGNRGQFYQCDTKGTVVDSWEGVRVQALAYRRDGKSVLAADTHHRIRAYNFEDLNDASILQESHGIMTFTLDDADRYALLNIATQGIHLWSVEEKCLVRRFSGITQGFYTIHSCFGGPDGSFIASGSEDNKVYIYHTLRENPIAELAGHGRTVNCVSWNPVYPRVLVSASDDSTLRVWGPSEKFRSNSNSSSSGSRTRNGVDAAGGGGSGGGPPLFGDYCGNGVV